MRNMNSGSARGIYYTKPVPQYPVWWTGKLASSRCSVGLCRYCLWGQRAWSLFLRTGAWSTTKARLKLISYGYGKEVRLSHLTVWCGCSSSYLCHDDGCYHSLSNCTEKDARSHMGYSLFMLSWTRDGVHHQTHHPGWYHQHSMQWFAR